ncbi:Alpha-xylosidase [Fulvia fulva]|uniref:alpha-D-xyloside xylohydrolase n=1 Tax=Passalora fulva TaxID=5499 RepID=A0A9Q8PBI2_PASFU|nr:Alpha-xylosidase [Fulvia fulva]KAK4621238.1 Alpha-xylosidase [Fulvia fulva]KAK4622773.1 Alpha-xylosidase [Fulvia fulva]UJO19454.1 Alpha-xylosidase [Fulvia fulva]WPV15999.1 Alpha-xylosidase [Fulvia fulva]WPV31396.1 Alpha-xylosidase [Fulvia fulva]
MKFRDGMWLVAEDKRVEYAEDIYSIEECNGGKKLGLLCPTAKIRSRGDTLNRPTLTVDLEAVSDGILSVEVTHWHGAVKKGPDFELFPAGQPQVSASISKTDTDTTLTSGSVAATVTAKPHTFDVQFHSADGKHKLTSLLDRSVAFAFSPGPGSPMQTADMRDFKHYILTQTTLGVGEQVYGLGERFGTLNKVGQSISLWNADGGTSSDQAYKNISFWLSNRGYGIFIDTPERVELEVGSERSCRVQTSVEGQRLKWYIIYGPSPKDILSRYTTLTGKPNKVPAWSFGLWLSTSFTTEYDEKTVNSFIEGMRDRDIPLQVFHYDCFWMRGFRWCDFEFMSSHFPDPKGQISRLKDTGLITKVCVWINPYLGQASPVFKEAADKDYLLKRKNGDVFQWDLWQAGMGIVDFTNPAACEWFVGCLKKLFDTGVDSIKTDFGERIPTQDVQWHDDSVDPARMHNFYPFMFNKLVFEALQERYGKDEAVLFARSACAGTQRFPLQWGGDCESTFEAMAESLRGGLSLGLSGFSYWSVDIGGFEGYPDATIYKRWVQFGLLCSHSRLHGSNSYRVPWLIDDDDTSEQGSTAVLRRFTQLKCRLMPYLYSQAIESMKHGWPVSVRAMALEFPDDRTAWYCDQQFMLGSSILVAPILNESGDIEFYLPAGRWTSIWDDTVVNGPRWVKETHGSDTLPIYLREGSILVLGKSGEKRTVYDWTKPDNHEIRLIEPNANSKFQLYDSDGQFYATLETQEDNGAWKVKGMEALNVRRHSRDQNY